MILQGLIAYKNSPINAVFRSNIRRGNRNKTYMQRTENPARGERMVNSSHSEEADLRHHQINSERVHAAIPVLKIDGIVVAVEVQSSPSVIVV